MPVLPKVAGASTKKAKRRPKKGPPHRADAQFIQLMSYASPWGMTPELVALDEDGNVWAWSETESSWVSSYESSRRTIR